MNNNLHDFGSFSLLYVLIVSLILSISTAHAAAKPKLVLTKASWSAKKSQLLIKGAIKKGDLAAPIVIYDLNGRRLAEATGSPFTLTLSGQALASIPCSIRVESGNLESVKKVIGSPKSCLKAPTCQILSPLDADVIKANQSIVFEARANLKNKRAGSLKTEWDFAGGVMQTDAQRTNLHNENNLKTDAVFVRDNSRYRVRFIATDAKNRRCEDSVEVVVGTPPSGLPTKVAEQTKPELGNELAGILDDLVVLPVEEWSMQTYTDSKLAGPYYLPMRPPLSTLTAAVYRKTRLPELLGPEQIELFYSAASNPSDPVAVDSINSTSQNWPVGSLLAEANLQKGDLFEGWVSKLAPAGTPIEDLPVNKSFVYFVSQHLGSYDEAREDIADIGSALRNREKPWYEPALPGQPMPGLAAPYQQNAPQAFNLFAVNENRFKARALPMTDIDDQGRVNPYPLFRIEARLPGTESVSAGTDAVLSATRDLHCRECHEKGGVGAKASNLWTAEARATREHHVDELEQPRWFEEEANNLFDREYAAQLNILSLHDYYDTVHFLSEHHHDYRDQWSNGCRQCHYVPLLDGDSTLYWNPSPGSGSGTSGMGGSVGRESGRIIGMPFYDNAALMHAFHGKLTYNENKDDILRWPSGRFRRWEVELDGGPNPRPLFPVKDAAGKLLPMEDNCLKCHGGQREQAYRDRHYTAGMTCYQCHGDMLAQGRITAKTILNSDGLSHRVSWFEQPNCGSCHTGNANRGKDQSGGFFSAGVMSIAFDELDPSATPRQPNAKDPDQLRFASPLVDIQDSNAEFNSPRITVPSFRLGKDAHGNVNCAACHGAAHATWPNRDPSANDNVTALQLQGHSGTILECNVCHDKEAFKNEKDLDGGPYMGVPEGVLGGPHNLHPVNDPYWWKSNQGDVDNPDKAGYGGWHNNYASKPGAANEDQCASCHGNDHKGTRLSKTPVDRTFDFSRFDFKALKKIGFKKPVIKVAAGTEIGCDTCHSIATSCKLSPNPGCGSTQGREPPPANRLPVFTSTPVTEVIKGELYQSTATASDPDGDEVTIRLTSNPTLPGNPGEEYQGALQFEPSTGQLSANWVTPDKTIIQATQWRYTLTADDEHGGIVNQTVEVQLKCPTGLILGGTDCVAIRISSEQPAYGLDAGQVFSYQVIAEQGAGLPLNYALMGAPAGMSVDADGLIQFDTRQIVEDSDFNPELVVSDSLGHEVRQLLILTVCVSPQHYDDYQSRCVGPITITSAAPDQVGWAGLNSGDVFNYQVSATHQQDLPLTYSLIDAPLGMTIDPKGLMHWQTTNQSVGEYSPRIRVQDAHGGRTDQPFVLSVCGPLPRHWDSEQGICVD